MSKGYSRFITALFCLFLGGMLVWSLVLPDRDHSETENRTLAQWPEFSWETLKSGEFTSDVEKYFADQFPMRDQWTGLKAHSELAIGKTEFNGTYLCENGEDDALIAKVEIPDAALLEKDFSYIQRLKDNVNAHVTLGLIPSAAEIWKDKLPKGAESWDQMAFLEQVQKSDLPTVDFHGALAAHAEEPIYYRTDHHWTSLGAFYGANAVFDALGKEPLRQEDFTREVASDQFYGTMYSQSGIHWIAPDTIEFWVPDEGLHITSWRTGKPEKSGLYDRTYLEKKDKYSAFLGGNQPLCVVQNEKVTDGSKVLVIRDSYSDSLAPFLAQRFSEVHLMDLRSYRGSVQEYVKENGIQDVVVLYSIPNFITDRNLVSLAK